MLKYEVQVRYNNGDKVDAQFHEKAAAIEFLEQYKTGNWAPIADSENQVNSDLVQ